MTSSGPSVFLAGRLAVPGNTQALLFDMDGVLIDSLAQDYAVAGPLLEPYSGPDVTVPHDVIRRWFPLAVDDFWVRVTADMGISLPPGALAEIVERHERLRRDTVPIVHDGVAEILEAAGELGLRTAVVSNNPRADVERMLAAGNLLPYFGAVVGNDEPGLARKPAPDPYLAAARALDVLPADCVAIEDSVLGLESARHAGCYVVGVATGAGSLETLSNSGFADRCYVDFSLADGTCS